MECAMTNKLIRSKTYLTILVILNPTPLHYPCLQQTLSSLSPQRPTDSIPSPCHPLSSLHTQPPTPTYEYPFKKIFPLPSSQRPIIFYLAHLNTLKGKIMQNKPNLGQSQNFITAVLKKNCNRKCELDTWSKQTQSNPILYRLSRLKFGWNFRGIGDIICSGRRMRRKTK